MEAKKVETAAEFQQFVDLLHASSVRDVLAVKSTAAHSPAHVVSVRVEDTLEKALELLASNGILSLPVLEGPIFIGFIDMQVVVNFTLWSWKRASWRLDRKEFLDEHFFHQTVGHVFKKQRMDRHTALIVAETATFKDLLDVFCDPAAHVYRVAVGDEQGGLKAVVSQRDCMKFIYHHAGLLSPTLLDTNISQLRLPHAPIVTQSEEPFASSLELLCSRGYSGVGIVDDKYQLTGCLSTSDLRGLKPDHFSFFTGTTAEFLRKVKEYRAPVTCGPLSTLKEVLTAMEKENLHRIFVVDERQSIRGVVTLSDLLALFSFLSQYY